MITDDNPFDDMPDDGGAFGGAPPPRPPKSQDAYVAPARPPKPADTMTTTPSATTIDMAEYERRLADLEARERAVEERERKVAQDQTRADQKMQQASKSGSSLSYFLFYIFFTIEIIIAILAVIGPKRSGLMGIIWTVEAFGEEGNKSVGIMCVINSILWLLSAGFMIYLWIHTRVNFQKAGGIKAMRKQAVEKATFGVVKAAKDHPDAAKKVGEAAVDYARENPEVVRDAASVAYDATSQY